MSIKISKKTADSFSKGGYCIYKGKKIVITNKYGNKSFKRLVSEMFDCFLTLLLGIISALFTPFILIGILISFIPKLYIIDENIDKIKTQKEDLINNELEELLKNKEVD